MEADEVRMLGMVGKVELGVVSKEFLPSREVLDRKPG